MPLPLLCTLGHVATTGILASRGVTRAHIRSAIADGSAVRLKLGTYACPHVSDPVRRAVEAGGALTCVSVLRDAGVWAGHSHQVHIQLAPGARSPMTSNVVRHWEHPRFRMDTPWLAGRSQALWRALHCLDEENALAAMESAVHEHYLPAEEVQRIAQLAPRRLQDALGYRVGDSGSGNETIVRYRLQRVGYAVEAQAYVPGMGHEDLLVEGCVGLDVDGRQWHTGEDRFANDRDRDLRVEGFGRRALRLRTSHIFETWPHTLAVIDRAVRDAKHEQLRRNGRVIISFDDPL